MALWDEVHIKQKIEVTVDTAGKANNFGCTIVRKNDTAVYFQMPAAPAAAAAIKKGVPCEVTIHTGDDSQLVYNAEISDVQFGTPATVQINRPPEEKIRQRTSSGAGIKIVLPLTYRVMKDPVTPISDTKKGETASLGANDCVIHTNNQIKPGSYAELNITLPKDDVQVSLVGLVQDSVEVKSGALTSYNSYLKYEVIRPGEQDKVVKFIFDYQRILRKRGMY